MANIQEIFNRIRETKKQQKDIKSIYRDALLNSHEYQALLEQIKKIKEKKKEIENGIRADFRSEFDKLERIKIDIESDNELLSDASLNQLLKGQSINLVDEHSVKYEPVFSVKFKKI